MENQSPPIFPNLMQTRPRIPRLLWFIGRIVALAIVVALAYSLHVYPELSLKLTWGLVIPLLPFLFFFVPGLWRNLCPLAVANQIPRMFGFTRGLALSNKAKTYAYVISIALLFILVAARKVFFNVDANALIILVVGAMLLAFIGGLIFKGKSGWCGTFCPLAPVQRIYGQTPFLPVRNSYCEPCIGCNKNCYDFNPAVAYLADLHEKDHKYVSDRKFFIGAFPGFIYAFYNVASPPAIPISEMYGQFIFYMLLSSGAYFFIETFVRLSSNKLAALFTICCLNLYYWYNFPTLAKTLQTILHLPVPDWGVIAAKAVLLTLTLSWLVKTFRKESLFISTLLASNSVRVGSDKPLSQIKKNTGQPVVTIMPDNTQINVEKNHSLLEVIEANDIPIEAGCRMGMCGADPVTILEGMEHLTPASDDERTTLQRLGLGENARMSCCARVLGPVTIQLGAAKDSTPAQPVSAGFTLDPKVKSIVIIGHGIAGVTAADHLRKYQPDCDIHLIGDEKHPLYNRMGISRLIYGRSAMQGLYLMPDSWYDEHRVTSWLNTHAQSIDRQQQQIVLGTGETLTYDRLILAMGSSSFIPPINNYGLAGCFELRTADQAMEIRAYAQQQQSQRALIAGGGLLGLEAAYALHKLGLHVTVLERANALLQRQLDEQAAQLLDDYLQGMGIHIIYQAEVSEVRGTEKVEQVILKSDQALECDIFLVAAGISPNKQLAADAGLETQRGVLVDEKLYTSDPHILAAGDIAEPRSNNIIYGLWAVAVHQAEIAACNALGADQAAETIVPSTTLKVVGINVTSMGDIHDQEKDTKIIVQHAPDEFRYGKLLIRDDKLCGAILIGYSELGAGVTQLIKQQTSIKDRLVQLEQGNWDCLL